MMNFAELKELSGDQRVATLKKLGNKYKKEDGSPDYKQMAQELGANITALAGMYSRDVKGIKFGRKKVEAVPEITSEIKQEEIKPEPKKRGRPKQIKDVNLSTEQKTEENKPEAKQEVKQEKPIESVADKKATFKFKTEVDGVMPCEEAQQRVIGIANSLLKGKEYKISFIVEEV